MIDKKYLPLIKYALIALLGISVFVYGYNSIKRYLNENEILKQMITRLEAETRVAEVLVTGVNYDEKTKKTSTTIKFLEYDSQGEPLEAKYFTFTGNIIQFQSLVIRFEDIHVRQADKLKGKSAYVFWKVFMLDGKKTQEFEIAQMNEVPQGYKIDGMTTPFEAKMWESFWSYALDSDKSNASGIKSAQIEAPGTMFVPGILYTIRIEHDGGLRIDSKKLSPILQGETIPAQF